MNKKTTTVLPPPPEENSVDGTMYQLALETKQAETALQRVKQHLTTISEETARKLRRARLRLLSRDELEKERQEVVTEIEQQRRALQQKRENLLLKKIDLINRVKT